MTAYYNEIDPYAAQWLRNLIAAGHIAPGDVDERSIEDVLPNELAGYTQCHFFAGIGVWSLALRRAGWPDDRAVWTGSCPCQPFSAAGQGAGFADERHLWPAFYHLISQCRPVAIFGEQVASKDADAWIDLVQDDMEAVGYAFGAIPFPSAGVGAPHIRDRLYWVASSVALGDAEHTRLEGFGGHGARSNKPGRIDALADGSTRQASAIVRLADTLPTGWTERRAVTGVRPTPGSGEFGGLERSDLSKSDGGRASSGEQSLRVERDARASSDIARPGPTNGFWRDADWLGCADGKFRPVEPGTFPLADGVANRMGKLRAYGNAINAQAAQIFIESVM